MTKPKHKTYRSSHHDWDLEKYFYEHPSINMERYYNPSQEDLFDQIRWCLLDPSPPGRLRKLFSRIEEILSVKSGLWNCNPSDDIFSNLDDDYTLPSGRTLALVEFIYDLYPGYALDTEQTIVIAAPLAYLIDESLALLVPLVR